VHNSEGDDCYLLKVRVRDAEALGELLRTGIGTVPGVRRTRTTIVMRTLHETARLPVEESGDA
jgi:Lrp/AsnC family leucine-responsive transcriptional regulator